MEKSWWDRVYEQGIMRINIISVGKIKEKYLKDAIEEYSKRLSKFCTLNIIEVSEVVAKVENETNIKNSIEEEGNEIVSKLDSFAKNIFIFVLDIDGKELSTIEFEKKIEEIKLNGVSEIVFIIGGSYGLSVEIKKKANFRLSFSKMTFPHQLFRIILLEQIYRAFKIANNEPYHK